jgi:hypothetical protein
MANVIISGAWSGHSITPAGVWQEGIGGGHFIGYEEPTDKQRYRLFRYSFTTPTSLNGQNIVGFNKLTITFSPTTPSYGVEYSIIEGANDSKFYAFCTTKATLTLEDLEESSKTSAISVITGGDFSKTIDAKLEPGKTYYVFVHSQYPKAKTFEGRYWPN